MFIAELMIEIYAVRASKGRRPEPGVGEGIEHVQRKHCFPRLRYRAYESCSGADGHDQQERASIV
jgi:hypothetical protein